MRAKKIPALGVAGISKGLGDHNTQYPTGDVPPVVQHATNPTDITLAILRKSAAAFGLTLCCRCSRCNAPLWNVRSVSAKLGPVCRRKQVPS